MKPGSVVRALAATATFLGVAAAQAREAHVENHCARLSEVGYDELDARVLLLLHARPSLGPLPIVLCNDQQVWLEWQEQRFDLSGRAIVEEAIEVIETKLRDEREAAQLVVTPSVTATSTAVADGEGEPPVSGSRKMTQSRGAGIAVALAGELPTGTVGASLGPVVDFGKSVGPAQLGGAGRISTVQ